MKYRFEGIGNLSAMLIMAVIAASPYGWMTVGLLGSLLRWSLSLIFMLLADNGLILANVGISKMEIATQLHNFDDVMEAALELVDARKAELSDAQKKKIDDRVIAVFDKFGAFDRLSNSGNS